MPTLPPRINFASWVWGFSGLNVMLYCVWFPIFENSTLLRFQYLLTFSAALLFTYCCGYKVRSGRAKDILIPVSISIALGFLFQLFAASSILVKYLPANAWIPQLLNRAPADIVLLSLCGMLFLLAGFLALSQRREYFAWVQDGTKKWYEQKLQ